MKWRRRGAWLLALLVLIVLIGGLAWWNVGRNHQQPSSPAQRVADVDAAIGKAVQFLDGEALAVPKAGHDPSAFGAEIDTEIDLFFHNAVRMESIGG